jgi:hypothetical protein
MEEIESSCLSGCESPSSLAFDNLDFHVNCASMVFFMAFEAGLISFQFGCSIDNKDCGSQGVLLSLGSAASWAPLSRLSQNVYSQFRQATKIVVEENT